MKFGYWVLLSNVVAFVCFGIGYHTGHRAGEKSANEAAAVAIDALPEPPKAPRSCFIVRDDIFISRRDAKTGVITHWRVRSGSEFFIPVLVTEEGRTKLLHECGFVKSDGQEVFAKAGDEIQFPDYAANGEMKLPEEIPGSDKSSPPMAPGETEEFPAPPLEYRPKQKDLFVRTFDLSTFYRWVEQQAVEGRWTLPDEYEIRDGRIVSRESGRQSVVFVAHELTGVRSSRGKPGDGGMSLMLPIETWQEWVATDPRAAIPRPPVAPEVR